MRRGYTPLYGPGEHFHPDRSHGLAALLRKTYEARQNGLSQVVIWGTGRPVREWLFVEDAVEALIMAADRYDRVDPLNVSVGEGISVTDLAFLIKHVVGFEGTFVYDSSKPDGAMLKTFSNNNIRGRIGWSPRTPLREGIARTLAWFEDNYAAATAER